MQASPALRIFATIAPSSAASRSASAKTRNGALPPSSIDVLTTLSAASASSTRPTSVEPVKDSLRTRGSCSMAETTAPDRREGTTLTTPAGTPASSRIAAIARAVSGVSLAGLSTTVQPAASAGPILRVAIAAGKFQGVTSTQMPTGCCTTRIRLAAGRRGHHRARRPHRFLGVPAEELRGVGHLAAGVGQRLAVLQRDQPGELLAPAPSSARTPGAGSRRAPGARSRPIAAAAASAASTAAQSVRDGAVGDRWR